MNLKLSNLVRRMNLSEVEEQFGGPSYVSPYAHIFPVADPKKEWQALVAQMIPGDELWEFAFGGALEFRSGIALKRGDNIVGHITVLES